MKTAKLKTSIAELTPPVVLRLRFIECMLYHYGWFNRMVIADYLGISIPQVSLDISQYKALAPGNTSYDIGQQRYTYGPAFVPLWPTEDSL